MDGSDEDRQLDLTGREDSANDWRPEGEALELLRDRSRVVPVIGAGVSAAAGLPGSNELRESLIENFDPHPDIEGYANQHDLGLVANDIINHDRERGIATNEFVAEFFRDALEQAPVEDVMRDLVRIPSRLIVTFNYDDAPERAAHAQGIPCESWTRTHDLSDFTERVEADEPPETLTVMHLHGSVNEPRSIVLDSRGYREVADDLGVGRLIGALMRAKRMCFLGTQLNEPYLSVLLGQNSTRDGRHPLFATRSTAEQAREMALNGQVEQNIVICEMPSRESLKGLVRFLAQEPEDPEPARPGTDGAPPAPEGGYVPNVIAVEERGRDPEETNMLAEFFAADSEALGDDVKEGFLTESEAAGGYRDLLIGVPGAGKSETLAELSRLTPGGVEPILMRLREADLGPADTTVRLARWVGRPTSGNDGADIVDVRSRTFHFYLDGLDEIPTSQQQRAVELVASTANAFPQHSFTVASRPVDALDGFDAVWRRLELTPGSVWQRRYLENHGVELGEIIDAIEGGSSMVELLQLPFFLSKAVDLHDRGLLGGDLDLWGTIQRFTDDALDDEGERALLPVTPGAARAWLRDVALAMMLAGHTVLERENLEDTPLPPGVEGDRTEICEALVNRSMLDVSQGGYAFTHRLIGESLAAEALMQRDSAPELIAAVAPNLDETVRGVRADWRMPLTFVMLRDERWRDAIGEVDPLQKARTTPNDAPLEERRAAAELIWRTYTDWEIWIWDRDVADVLQDDTALGRLIAAGGIDDLVAEIREALDHDSPRVQGNAARVLARGGVEGLGPDLERIVEDDEREEVVRRKAALAAAHLNLHDLLETIIERGASTHDDIEAQDMAIAALRLADEDELLEVATGLVSNRRSHPIVLTRIEKRLSSADLVTFLRAYAPTDVHTMSYEKKLLNAAAEAHDARWSGRTVEDLAYVATVWEQDTAAIGELLSASPDAALRGIAAAAADTHWSEATHLIDLFSADQLAAAGLDEALVEIRQRHEEAQHEPAAERPVALEGEDERQRDPTLAEMLTLPNGGGDQVIVNNASYFESQVRYLDDAAREDLKERVERWASESDKRVREAVQITSADGSRWTIENWASALVWYGAALNLPLSAENWADIACSGILFEPQSKWLQEKASEESVAAAVATCDSGEARVWSQLLRATPEGLIAPIAAVLPEHLAGEQQDEMYVRQIADRLLEEDQIDALERLGTIEPLIDAVLPRLARTGQREAVEAMLATLEEDLNEGRRPDSDELTWLEGARDERYLDQLFRCLVVAYRPGRSSSGRRPVWVDPVTPLMNAIRSVGGLEIVRRYDEVLETEEGVEFLRLQRNNAADIELAEAGLTAAADAARVAGVAVLSQE